MIRTAQTALQTHTAAPPTAREHRGAAHWRRAPGSRQTPRARAAPSSCWQRAGAAGRARRFRAASRGAAVADGSRPRHDAPPRKTESKTRAHCSECRPRSRRRARTRASRTPGRQCLSSPRCRRFAGSRCAASPGARAAPKSRGRRTAAVPRLPRSRPLPRAPPSPARRCRRGEQWYTRAARHAAAAHGRRSGTRARLGAGPARRRRCRIAPRPCRSAS